MRLTKNKFVCNPTLEDLSFSSVGVLSGTEESESGAAMSPLPSFGRVPKFIRSLQRLSIRPMSSDQNNPNIIRKLFLQKPSCCKLENKQIADQEEGHSDNLQGEYAYRATQPSLLRKGTTRSQVTPKRSVFRTPGLQADSMRAIPHQYKDLNQFKDEKLKESQKLKFLLNAKIEGPMVVQFPISVDLKTPTSNCSPKSILKRNGAFSKLLERKDTNQSNRDSRVTLESCSHSKRSSEKKVAFSRNKLVMVVSRQQAPEQIEAPKIQVPSLRTVFIKKPSRRRQEQPAALGSIS